MEGDLVPNESPTEYITDKLTFSYVFHHNLKKVSRLLRDMNKTGLIFNLVKNGYVSKITFLQGKKTWTVGANFFYRMLEQLTLYFVCLEYKEEESQTTMKWHVYTTDPPTTPSFLHYEIYGNSSLDSTCTLVVTWIWEFIPRERKKIVEKASIEEGLFSFSTLDKFLTYENIEKTIEEKIQLKSSLEEVWSIVKDLNIWKKISPELCELVSYSDVVKVGTKISIVSKQGNKSLQKALIIIKEIQENEKHCQITYESLIGSPIIPPQTIVHSVKNINNDLFEVSMKQIYKGYVSPEEVESNRVKKKIILLRLKQNILNKLEYS